MRSFIDPYGFLAPIALSKPRSWPPVRNYEDWNRLLVQSWFMCADAGAVVVLRSCRLMGGGRDAHDEAHTMVTEKVSAMAEAAMNLAFVAPTSGSTAARTAMAPFRKRVSANRRRLAKLPVLPPRKAG